MTIRARIARPVLVASLSAAALLGSAALPALAAPSASPTSASSTQAPTPSTKPSASKAAGPTASASPSRVAESRRAAFSVVAPTSTGRSAFVRVTGGAPGVTYEASAGRDTQAQAESVGKAVANSAGEAVIELKAPGAGWHAGATYHWGAFSQAGQSGSGVFTMPGGSTQKSTSLRIAVHAPAGAHDPVVFSVSNLKKGQWTTVTGAPAGWTKEAPYFREVDGTADGSQDVRFEAPTAGWPLDVEYTFTFTGPDGQVQTRSFIVRSGKDAKGTPSPDGAAAPAGAKESTGGLPKTGF